MKRVLILLSAVLIYSESHLYAQQFIAGAEGSYLLPYSGLADRFMPAPAFAVYLGKEVSTDWTWTGKLEYFKYDRINKDKYSIKRIITLNNADIEVTLPLQDTTQELSAVGLSANASYNLIRTDWAQVSLGFGFGIYRWESTTGSYHDTLYYKDNSGTEVVAEVLKIPHVKQLDWSGGFSAGFSADIHIYGPLWANAGASYKNVIGELWAVLSLDRENVSTFQMFQTTAGLFVKL